MLDKVIIVAGGKNTRFGSMSVFPKVLLPINGNESILSYDYKIFKRLAKEIVLIINKTYEKMVREYVANLSLPITILPSTNTNGSANTILSVWKDWMPEKGKMMFIWSDLILEKDAVEDMIDVSERVVEKNPECEATYGLFELDYRLGINNENILSTNAHNLPGIYIIHDTSKLNKIASSKYTEYEDYDLASLISDKFNYGTAYYEGKLYEYRDLEAFNTRYLSVNDENDLMKTRFFNQLTINKDGTLIKKCVDKKYDHLIEDEVEWYKKVESAGVTPKIISYDIESPNHFIKMEYIKGKPLHTKLFSGYENNIVDIDLLIAVVNTVKRLHSSFDPLVVYDERRKEDYKIEYLDKTIARVESVKDCLINYNEDEFKKALTKVYDYVVDNSSTNYNVIHGDLNGSNVLVDETGKIKMIDSRGHFGNTKIYGPKEYDYAKILYCVSGYDRLNIDRIVYNPKSDSPLTPSLLDTIECGATIIAKHSNLDKKLLIGILAVIYLSLTSYIGQDIMKANLAYDRGIKIIEHYF